MGTKDEKKVLIVDDAVINREMLKKIFSKEYGVITASNGREALEIVEREKKSISIILLDIVMPEMNGYDVLEALGKKNYLHYIPVIMITGDNGSDVEQKCLEMGAVDFINKPFEPKIAFRRAYNAIELYQHKNQLEMLVSLQVRKLKDLNTQIIEKLSAVVEFRDVESGQHIKRVKTLTGILLKHVAEMYPEYGLNDKNIEMIISASALHDIGKITIPDNILLKPGKLTKDEFDIMQGHTTKGSEIVKGFAFTDNKAYFNYCYDICRHHHERFDGNGYPDKLVGDDISIASQVVSVADVYDALVSERVYKDAYSHETACKMIIEGECGIFNPKMLKCFYASREEFKNMVITE